MGYVLRQEILLNTAQQNKGDSYLLHTRSPWIKYRTWKSLKAELFAENKIWSAATQIIKPMKAGITPNITGEKNPRQLQSKGSQYGLWDLHLHAFSPYSEYAPNEHTHLWTLDVHVILMEPVSDSLGRHKQAWPPGDRFLGLWQCFSFPF